VVAQIVTHPPATVALIMKQNGRGKVDVDFKTDGPLEFATYNASLNRNIEGQLVTDLSDPAAAQPRAVAEIIQRTNPNVILINEFDYDAAGTAATLFRRNFLEVSQKGAPAVHYPYQYVAPSNTGIASGFDLNNNGAIVTTPGAAGYGDDALGFGAFPGQFGMVVYSKLPIDTNAVRTFQRFLWKDMPGALLPDDTATPEAGDFYSPEELAIFRLSSKSHWDIPLVFRNRRIHFLASHPTPPVFDGVEDRNGRRNFDEIRLWADYVTPGKGDYIYDDLGATGGLAAGEAFVVAGDMNSDPLDGDSIRARLSCCSTTRASRSRSPRPAPARPSKRRSRAAPTRRTAGIRSSTPPTSPTPHRATSASTTCCRRISSRSTKPGFSGR
jgi:3-phytase